MSGPPCWLGRASGQAVGPDSTCQTQERSSLAHCEAQMHPGVEGARPSSAPTWKCARPSAPMMEASGDDAC
jgi:hypothetical protein